MNSERRQAERVPITAPLIFRTANAVEGDGHTLNVSRTGLSFSTPVSPGSSPEVLVYFKLAGRQYLAQGQIVRTAQNQVAIVFREAPRGLEQLLAPLEKPENPN